jgi:hypothetical protein
VSDLQDIVEDFLDGQGANDYLFRNRAYKGQPHTHNGERGKLEVKGITMRDLHDAFCKGACLASGHLLNGELYDSAKLCRITESDIYRLDWNRLDPVAVLQNMLCEVEKMMGVFPNIPGDAKS